MAGDDGSGEGRGKQQVHDVLLSFACGMHAAFHSDLATLVAKGGEEK
jgi:hypothetical protein